MTSALRAQVNKLDPPSNSPNRIARRSFLSAALIGIGFWSSRTESLQNQSSEVNEHSTLDRCFQTSLPHAQNSSPYFQSRLIEHSDPLGFVHCASICQSKSGKSICAWYGGSREGARDVQIWMSSFSANSTADEVWSEPRSIMGFPRAAEDTNQFVRKVGNAVTFFDSNDRLWMIYVSIAMGGWATSSLNATYSDDHGATWAQSQRLWLSPLLNISQLVRCPPVFMKSGEIGLPIYNECAGIFPEMLWLQPTGGSLTYHKSRICGGRDWLQPSVVPTGDQTAICYLRCLNESRRVGFATTNDAGLTWSTPATLELPNPNSAVCAVRLQDSGVLMALNYSTDSRDSLSLVYSANGVSQWKQVATLDQQPGEKFSYPSMIRGQDGLIHLVYSWQMKKIRHISLNDTWVTEQLTNRLNSPTVELESRAAS